MIKVEIEKLTKDGFDKYGKVILTPEEPPTKQGSKWKCWNYVEMMEASVPIGMGIVVTENRTNKVEAMERHVSREELLFPVKQPIIQPVAECKDITNPQEKPDPKTVSCFRINPGQGIIIAKGVWHSPAYPVGEESKYFFGIEDKEDKFGDELDNPWINFKNNELIKYSGDY